MEIVRWVLLIGLSGLCTWLLIDTIIFIVKKRKQKAQTKRLEEQKQIDENDNHN